MLQCQRGSKSCFKRDDAMSKEHFLAVIHRPHPVSPPFETAPYRSPNDDLAPYRSPNDDIAPSSWLLLLLLLVLLLILLGGCGCRSYSYSYSGLGGWGEWGMGVMGDGDARGARQMGP